MDLDGDGYLSPQEYLRYVAKTVEDDRLQAIADGEDPQPGRPRPGFPGEGHGV